MCICTLRVQLHLMEPFLNSHISYEPRIVLGLQGFLLSQNIIHTKLFQNDWLWNFLYQSKAFTDLRLHCNMKCISYSHSVSSHWIKTNDYLSNLYIAKPTISFYQTLARFCRITGRVRINVPTIHTNNQRKVIHRSWTEGTKIFYYAA